MASGNGEDESNPERRRAKDLLRSGELKGEASESERFGDAFAARRLRRPVGNSRRLWKRVEGDDPFDGKPKAPPKEKPRGVYAAGRFVRVDKFNESQEKAKKAKVPDWAAPAPRSAPRPSDQSREAEVKATPTAEDPLARLMQTIAQKNREAQTKLDKADDASSRLKKKQEVPQEPPPPSLLPGETPGGGMPAVAPPPQVGRSSQKSSKTGRMRTSSQRVAAPPVARPAEPQKPRAYAAGRAPPKPRAAPVDLPVEMRTPPRVDPARGEQEAPRQRRYAAGRAPPKPRAAPKDIPIEMRRPPRVGVEGAQDAGPPEFEIRRDSPAFNRPGKKTVSSKPAAVAAAKEVPVKPTPAPKPAAPPAARKAPSGGLDDLFGGGGEGPVRIGRRKKQSAKAEPEKATENKAPPGSQQPPFPIPKVAYDPTKDSSSDD